ncbi:MAG: hypothetical protein ACTSRS_12930 [Candidatus Helarchaeota archaeon]
MTQTNSLLPVEPITFHWDSSLSSDEKIKFLRTLFGGSFEHVSFWDLYRTVKKLHSS